MKSFDTKDWLKNGYEVKEKDHKDGINITKYKKGFLEFRKTEKY